MNPKNKLLLVLIIFISVSSCSSLRNSSTAEVDSATIHVGFLNESKLQERWSIIDANTEAIVFEQELFQPGEVKRASISTGPSRRFGEVRYKDLKAIVWTRDSLIENNGVVELRAFERISTESSE